MFHFVITNQILQHGFPHDAIRYATVTISDIARSELVALRVGTLMRVWDGAAICDIFSKLEVSYTLTGAFSKYEWRELCTAHRPKIPPSHVHNKHVRGTASHPILLSIFHSIVIPTYIYIHFRAQRYGNTDIFCPL